MGVPYLLNLPFDYGAYHVHGPHRGYRQADKKKASPFLLPGLPVHTSYPVITVSAWRHLLNLFPVQSSWPGILSPVAQLPYRDCKYQKCADRDGFPGKHI